MRRRLLPTLAVALALAAGLGARAALRGLPAKVLGVAFYATFVYALVVPAWPSVRVGRAFLVAVALCFSVEFAQLPLAGLSVLSTRALALGGRHDLQPVGPACLCRGRCAGGCRPCEVAQPPA